MQTFRGGGGGATASVREYSSETDANDDVLSLVYHQLNVLCL